MSEIKNWITFDKDDYHLYPEMEQWCRDNIGPGCWTFGKAKTWEGMGENLWAIDSMFGRTTFAFRDDKHLTHFLLKWA